MSRVMDYKQAGVDIEAGDALVSWLKAEQPQNPPHKDRIVSSIGGFSALFRAQFPDMKQPCLVSATDGVGTKLKWAIELNTYKEVAQDLVAMCVNDLICCGAEPLFFLDYYATGKLKLEPAKEFLSSLQKACHESHCALIGGETAEMPGLYQGNDFDCAGFAVGVVDEGQVLGSHRVREGARLIGVSSSGFHSNGFSLLRKLFDEDLSLWATELMKPTHLYVHLAQELKTHLKSGLMAMAHITGGGLDNLTRVMPDYTEAPIQLWKFPNIVQEAQKRSGLKTQSLLKTFNCGVGLILIVDPTIQSDALAVVQNCGYQAFELGEVKASGDKEPNWSLQDE